MNGILDKICDVEFNITNFDIGVAYDVSAIFLWKLEIDSDIDWDRHLEII